MPLGALLIDAAVVWMLCASASLIRPCVLSSGGVIVPITAPVLDMAISKTVRPGEARTGKQQRITQQYIAEAVLYLTWKTRLIWNQCGRRGSRHWNI